MLEGLLNVQHELQQYNPEIKLITDQELIAIQVNWYRDFNFAHQVSEIYNWNYMIRLLFVLIATGITAFFLKFAFEEAKKLVNR